MAFYVQEAVLDNYGARRESGAWIRFLIFQQDADEMAFFLPFVDQKLFVNVDWGDGSKDLGLFMYNGFKHKAKLGGFSLDLESDLDHVVWSHVVKCKKNTTGAKKEEDRRTCQLTILTPEESGAMLEQRDTDDDVFTLEGLEESDETNEEGIQGLS